MKKSTILDGVKFFLMAIVCLLVSNMCLARERAIPLEHLPAKAKAFVQSNFKSNTIIFAEKDGSTFECRLDDGTLIDFKSDGSWVSVDRSVKAVPSKLIPETIQEYVDAKFTNCMITKIDKTFYGYEIELSNDLDLKFNNQGKLISIKG